MTRPPIEEWQEGRGGVYMYRGCLDNLCAYVLELEAKVKRLEEALRKIADGRADEWFCWQEIAENALKEESHE